MNCRETMAASPLYLSGELDPDATAEARAHLASCAGCAAELEQLAELDRRLRDSVLGEAIDTARLDRRVRWSIAPRRGWWIGAGAGAAAAAVLLIALWTGRAAPAPDPVCAAAAGDHHREVVDGRPRTWLRDDAAIQALAAREGIETAAIPRLDAAGLRLDRARLCRLDGSPFLHLVYSDGRRDVSVFLRKAAGGASAIRSADSGAEHVAWFETARTRAIVVANQSRATAVGVAHLAQAVL